jgi:Tfp pilus assembly protein PilX
VVAVTRRSREAGFVLPEVLTVMIIATLLLGATLVTFERFVVHENESDNRNDNIEMARNALDIEARQLRNLAKRVTDGVIASPLDGDSFTFQTSDPTRTWVRYCLDSSAPANGKVWLQLQSLTTAVTSSPVTAGMQAGCPSTDANWSSTRVVVDHVVNRYNGRNRPMFSYRCAGGGTACTSSSSTYDQIIGVDASLYVDTRPTDNLPEQLVRSGVYLRNQNQAPTADFTATTISGTPRTMLFNASGSADYEQRTLAYFWFLNTMPTAASIRCDLPPADGATTAWGGTLIGRGLTLQYTWPGTVPASGSTQTVGLVVCDPGDRHSPVATQIVTIPT